jgi:GNAT superfamily N-acetyltransferase
MAPALLRVSPATPADQNDVCELLREQFREHDIVLADRLVASGVEGLLADPSRGAVLVAKEHDALVGFAILALTWTVEHGGRVAWLEELYVVPSRRAVGIGTILLDHALRTASEMGCLAVDLEVDVEHARAEHLYARAGFRRLPRARWSLGLRG